MPKYFATLSPDLVTRNAPFSFRNWMARTLSSLFIRATGLPTRATDCSISSSSTSLTLMMRSGSVCSLSLGGQQIADGALHHHQRRNVVVDGEDGRHGFPALLRIYSGGGLEDLAVRRPGQIAQMVPGRARAWSPSAPAPPGTPRRLPSGRSHGRFQCGQWSAPADCWTHRGSPPHSCCRTARRCPPPAV